MSPERGRGGGASLQRSWGGERSAFFFSFASSGHCGGVKRRVVDRGRRNEVAMENKGEEEEGDLEEEDEECASGDFSAGGTLLVPLAPFEGWFVASLLSRASCVFVFTWYSFGLAMFSIQVATFFLRAFFARLTLFRCALLFLFGFLVGCTGGGGFVLAGAAWVSPFWFATPSLSSFWNKMGAVWEEEEDAMTIFLAEHEHLPIL